MRSSLIAIAVALLTFAVPRGASAQVLDPNWKPEGPVPHTADGKPDLKGVWWQGRDLSVDGLNVGTPRTGERPAPRPGSTFASLYQPWAAAKAKTLSDKDDPALNCIPSVDGPQASNVFQILQTPEFVVYLQETYHGFRLIPIGPGRKHDEEAPPAYRGDSVGRWEGDTLVVDVTDFNDRNWIFAQGNVSFHSEALHVIERYHRIAANALEIQRTFEDPKVLTQPWVQPKKMYSLAPFDQIMEAMCTNIGTAALMKAAAEQNYGNKK